MTDKPETVADVLADIDLIIEQDHGLTPPARSLKEHLISFRDRIERAMAASAVPVAGCGWAECPHGADCVHAPPAVPVESPPASVPDGLLAATRRLAFAARTSGGTAGHDAELCAALDAIEAILATTPEESP